LDGGCNRGGFLCLVNDTCGIVEGCGYDPASSAIDDARRLAGPRPLRFDVADTVPASWEGFDVAFSHEVLYLIHDLGAHAHAIFEALVPGGTYYAVMGVHAGSPLQVAWHRAHAEELHLPKLYDIDDVAGVFGASGFAVSAARLKVGFVPAFEHCAEPVAGSPTDAAPELLARMEYYNEHKLLLRCQRPPRRD
jgi:SAM-dependent methyltransferase